ncbi:MAG: hypothetical protein EPN25_00885 [Nitrospirae bacterium]|nr:MAG: hypothetical protein EPN25_00885 [Nitrospirota bacterium]
MMRGRTFFSVSVLLLLLFAGCSRPVATVNGREIDGRLFDLLIKEKSEALKQQLTAPDMKSLREAVVNELIMEAMILEDAERAGLKVTDDEIDKEIGDIKRGIGEDAFKKTLKEKGLKPAQFRKRTREKLLMSRFMEGLVNREPVTGEEIRNYYAASQKPFFKPSQVLMNMIEFESQETARAVIREMREKNIDFDEMAKRQAAEKKAVASDYGWVNPELFSLDLSYGVRNLRAGQYGGPFKGKRNYYLVKVREKEKETIASFDEMRDTIKNLLLEQKRQAAFAHWLDAKKKSSKVEVHIR